MSKLREQAEQLYYFAKYRFISTHRAERLMRQLLKRAKRYGDEDSVHAIRGYLGALRKLQKKRAKR